MIIRVLKIVIAVLLLVALGALMLYALGPGPL
jgi:hypothetical protein